MPYTFPIPQESVEKAQISVEQEKTKHDFDVLLSRIIARHAPRYGLVTASERRRLQECLVTHISHFINPHIIAVICSSDLNFYKDLPPLPERSKRIHPNAKTPTKRLYTQNDEVDELIKDIIFSIYENSITSDKKFVSRKLNSCKNVLKHYFRQFSIYYTIENPTL